MPPTPAELSGIYFSPVLAASLSNYISKRFLLELLRKKNGLGHIFFILMAEQKDRLPLLGFTKALLTLESI